MTYDLLDRTDVLEAPPARAGMGLRHPHLANAEVVFIRDRQGLHRVRQNAIRSLHADGNYVELHCDRRRFVLRSSLRDVLLQFGHTFVQVNRNTAVNVRHLERVDGDTVTVEGIIHILSRNFRSAVLERITVLG